VLRRAQIPEDLHPPFTSQPLNIANDEMRMASSSATGTGRRRNNNGNQKQEKSQPVNRLGAARQYEIKGLPTVLDAIWELKHSFQLVNSDQT